jgi:hypothetical protein
VSSFSHVGVLLFPYVVMEELEAPAGEHWGLYHHLVMLEYYYSPMW